MTNKNIDSNRENSREHTQERVSKYNDREDRPTNRDTEIIKLPDGREFVRNPRTILKRHGALSDLPKKAGFIRRWVSSNIPNRLQDLIDLGYKEKFKDFFYESLQNCNPKHRMRFMKP